MTLSCTRVVKVKANTCIKKTTTHTQKLSKWLFDVPGFTLNKILLKALGLTKE